MAIRARDVANRLTDNFGAKFDAEYIDGDFFVDFTDGTNEDLITIMKSKFVTIEFGSENERLLLYTADTAGDHGEINLKGALRDFIPSLAKTQSWGNVRIVGTSEMFGLCQNTRRGDRDEEGVDGNGSRLGHLSTDRRSAEGAWRGARTGDGERADARMY
jgi:predicted deacylase